HLVVVVQADRVYLDAAEHPRAGGRGNEVRTFGAVTLQVGHHHVVNHVPVGLQDGGHRERDVDDKVGPRHLRLVELADQDRTGGGRDLAQATRVGQVLADVLHHDGVDHLAGLLAGAGDGGVDGVAQGKRDPLAGVGQDQAYHGRVPGIVEGV